MLDMKTVAVTYILSAFLGIVILVLLWYQHRKRYSGLNLWWACYTFQLIALLLLVFRGFFPAFLSVVVHTLIASGNIFLYIGLQAFLGKTSSQKHNYFIIAFSVLAYAFFVYGQPSFIARQAISSLVHVIIFSQCAWLLLRRVDNEQLKQTRFLGILFILYCCTYSVRIVMGILHHSGNDFFTLNMLGVIPYLVIHFLFIAVVFGLSLTVNRRLSWDLEIDIAERKKAEDQIKASLKEKETLLQEIHHRVKNNLTVVSSLLNLHGNSVENDQVKNALKESQGRIYAMSAVHEALYNAKNLAVIDLKTYLSKISGTLIQTYSVNPGRVKLNIDGDDIKLNIDKASPIGLTINELISNSLKYAFPDNRAGEITMNLKKLDKDLELIVMDNGIGIPEDVDLKNSSTLGLKLVRTLVENQLDGSIDMENKKGTKFTIKFNIEN